MIEREVEIVTADGAMNAWAIHPEGTVRFRLSCSTWMLPASGPLMNLASRMRRSAILC